MHKSAAVTQAVTVVQSALASGAIKLGGAVGMNDPAHQASEDAKYLSTLIKDLSATIYEEAKQK